MCRVDGVQADAAIQDERAVNLIYAQARAHGSACARDVPRARRVLDARQGRHADAAGALRVHGGPWARDFWGFNSAAQWFANRGYACLQVNYRGSSGYGKSFLHKGDKEWGVGAMQHDLTDAVQWAVDEGIADPENVCVFTAAPTAAARAWPA